MPLPSWKPIWAASKSSLIGLKRRYRNALIGAGVVLVLYLAGLDSELVAAVLAALVAATP